MSPLFPPTDVRGRQVGDPGRITVVGLSHASPGVDAVGSVVVDTLAAGWDVPGGVQLVDAGSPGVDLKSLLAESDAAIVVDAVPDEGRPGTIRCYDRAMLAERPAKAWSSARTPGLADTLLTLEDRGVGPSRLLLVGVTHGENGAGPGLTPPLRAAVNEMVDTVLDALGALGRPPRRKRPDRDPEAVSAAALEPVGAGTAGPG